jgi:hypothetical protein
MDTYRGNFIDLAEGGSDTPEADFVEDDAGQELPPSPVGQDERRMQVRAYNHWASLLNNRNFPSVEDLDPDSLPDFGPFSVLLDFTGGIDNPAVQYLGNQLAAECGATGPIHSLDDVPTRSLLSRITDHYMQILANQAPIGFEAEFVNQRERTVLYRGILLPFSSDDDTIDFIYGVINWKELADQQTTDELLLEIDQALDVQPRMAPLGVPHTEWSDGPADIHELSEDSIIPSDIDLPEPEFGGFGEVTLKVSYQAEAVPVSVPAAGEDTPIDPVTGMTRSTGNDEDMGLADWLASARELARAAQGSEDRTRHALYSAIGRAYDFSLAAADAPEEFDELIADSGLTTQDRAPMTPVVKLVFGADYDKTRLTEYAAALGHAHRLGLGSGMLAEFLSSAPGGLKGVVTAERQLRRDESGKAATVRETPREALARKLRKLDHQPLDAVSPDGSEFTLLIARRLANGEIVLLGEVGDDIPLLERAARKLLN